VALVPDGHSPGFTLSFYGDLLDGDMACRSSPRSGCQQGVSGSHGYSPNSEPRFGAKTGLPAAKTRNSTHSPALRRRDHNPRVGFESLLRHRTTEPNTAAQAW
jgi:hypothetical protein